MKWTERHDLPLYLLRHSCGGHALALLPEPLRIRPAYAFGTGAGWLGGMAPLERVRVWFMRKLLAPRLTAWTGNLPWKMLGMGEDLSVDVYRQWRRWCQYPRYFFDDPQQPGLEQQFARIGIPIVAVNASGDAGAPPRSATSSRAGTAGAVGAGGREAARAGRMQHRAQGLLPLAGRGPVEAGVHAIRCDGQTLTFPPVRSALAQHQWHCASTT